MMNQYHFITYLNKPYRVYTNADRPWRVEAIGFRPRGNITFYKYVQKGGPIHTQVCVELKNQLGLEKAS